MVIELNRPATSGLDIRTLTEADVDALRLTWHGKLNPDEVRRTLFLYPGRSTWLPATLEFALIAPWRHRHEIAHLQELTAVRHPVPLTLAAIDRAEELGALLAVVLEVDDVRRPAFYAAVGLELIEEVVTYELDRIPPYRDPRSRTRFQPIDLRDPAAVELIMAIDHAAFPWVWWNGGIEIESYALLPDVELFLALRDEAPVGYVGVTSYYGWGHLDRVAVLPRRQGEGIGRDALAFAVDRLTRRGARRVGLSTQLSNVRSRQLYERFGFRRSRINDYRLYGRPLGPLAGSGFDFMRPGVAPASAHRERRGSDLR